MDTYRVIVPREHFARYLELVPGARENDYLFATFWDAAQNAAVGYCVNDRADLDDEQVTILTLSIPAIGLTRV